MPLIIVTPAAVAQEWLVEYDVFKNNAKKARTGK
jgi:hypothetical protein